MISSPNTTPPNTVISPKSSAWYGALVWALNQTRYHSVRSSHQTALAWCWAVHAGEFFSNGNANTKDMTVRQDGVTSNNEYVRQEMLPEKFYPDF
jgi:hypothetical protein